MTQLETRWTGRKIIQQLLDDGYYDGQSSFECADCGSMFGGYPPRSSFDNSEDYRKWADEIKEKIERTHKC